MTDQCFMVQRLLVVINVAFTVIDIVNMTLRSLYTLDKIHAFFIVTFTFMMIKFVCLIKITCGSIIIDFECFDLLLNLTDIKTWLFSFPFLKWSHSWLGIIAKVSLVLRIIIAVTTMIKLTKLLILNNVRFVLNILRIL